MNANMAVKITGRIDANRSLTKFEKISRGTRVSNRNRIRKNSDRYMPVM